MSFSRRTLTRRTTVAAFAAAVMALPATAFAQTPEPPSPAAGTPPSPGTTSSPSPRPRWRIGPDIGTYLPTSARTRDRFGSAWLILGFGVGNVSDIHPSHRVSFDLNVLGASRSGERVLLVPFGLSYSVALGPETAATVPYAGISADGAVVDLRSDRDHLPSRTSLTGGGSLFVGTRFSQTGYVEARYNALGAVRGFDLSGITLRLGLRF